MPAAMADSALIAVGQPVDLGVVYAPGMVNQSASSHGGGEP